MSVKTDVDAFSCAASSVCGVSWAVEMTLELTQRHQRSCRVNVSNCRWHQRPLYLRHCVYTSRHMVESVCRSLWKTHRRATE